MDSKRLERLRDMAARATSDYAGIKAEAEGQVVRWEWATCYRYSFYPAYFEIYKFVPRGKLIPPGTPLPENWSGYGFDAEERIVVERNSTSLAGQWEEVFYFHEEEGIRAYEYDYGREKHWNVVSWFSIQNGRVVTVDELSSPTRFSIGFYSLSMEIYSYNEKSQMVRQETRYPLNAPDDLYCWYELEYNARGKVVRIQRYDPNGTSRLQYERANPKLSLKTHKKELLEGLTAAIIEGLRKLAITDEVYVLVVRYWSGGIEHVLPPCIGLNTVPEAERLLKEHPEDPEEIWNPCAWLPHHCDVIYHPSPEIEALCSAVNLNILQKEQYKQVNLFLHELLHTLLNAELPLRLAKDCVFIGLYVEHGEYELQVKEQLPEADRKLLMKKGWLPKNK